MFYTSPAAFVPTSKLFGSDASKKWRWIEFGLYMPYFLVTLRISDGDSEIDQHLMFGQIQDLMAHAVLVSDNAVIIEIGLLSPGYMNGTDNYLLGKLKEVWISKQQSLNLVFVMTDGQKLQFPPDEEISNLDEYELLVAI
jgi:hypothetical protein